MSGEADSLQDMIFYDGLVIKVKLMQENTKIRLTLPPLEGTNFQSKVTDFFKLDNKIEDMELERAKEQSLMDI